MPNYTSIKHLSALLDHPHTITDGDKGSVSTLVQSYPYFLPARYLTALQGHRKDAFSAAMRTAAEPYLGNWLLFCSFLNGDEIASPEAPAQEYQPGPLTEVHEEVMRDEPRQSIIADDDAEDIPVGTQPDFTEAAVVEELVFNKDVFESTAETDAIFEPINEAVSQPAGEGDSEMAEHQAQDEDEERSAGAPEAQADDEEPLIMPVYTTDYFQEIGEKVSDEIPGDMDQFAAHPEHTGDEADSEKKLMVMMSFSEWLMHFKNTAEKQAEETKDQKALKTMWQKEKLAAALEEENDEIPENVFEMAVNSISREDGLASETLADIYIKQGKYDQAIEMYRKLSLRNPQKNAYFARKIEEVLKNKQS